MAHRHRCCLILSGIVFAVPFQVDAVDLSLPGEPIEVHGFASQGFIKSTDNNYLARSKRGSFEFTEVGINFTKELTDKLRVGIQLFARHLGPLDSFNAKFDWFYLDYHWADWLGFRAGRVKLPFGLYNEINDIDSARVPILLPQSIYPTENRDFLLAQTGGELYGRVAIATAGTLDYAVYGGTIFFESTTPPNSPFKLGNLTTPYVVGGRLLWETPLDGLRAGGSLQALRLDTDLFFDAGRVTLKIPAVLWVGSVEYSAQDLLLAAEYSRWYVSVDSTQPALFPESPTTVSERFYGMATYRLTRRFQSGLYYSVLFPNVDNRKGRENRQHDVAATLRFDINDHWLIKLEGHYMHGTAALNSALNDDKSLGDLKQDWAVFLIKTTAYF